jgi:hypothetical protein
MPASGPSRGLRISTLRDTVQTQAVLPLLAIRAGGSTNTFRPPNGAGVYMASDPAQISGSVVALFSTGELWAIDSALLDGHGSREVIPFCEPLLQKALSRYIEVLAAMGVGFPLRWIAGMRGIRGRPLVYPSTPTASAHSVGGGCVTDFVFREGVIENGGQVKHALSPFFDELFEQCGISRPKHLDQPARLRD